MRKYIASRDFGWGEKYHELCSRRTMISKTTICDLLGRRRSSPRVSPSISSISPPVVAVSLSGCRPSYRFARLDRLFYRRAADARRTTDDETGCPSLREKGEIKREVM